jgi:hypothetical protein
MGPGPNGRLRHIDVQVVGELISCFAVHYVLRRTVLNGRSVAVSPVAESGLSAPMMLNSDVCFCRIVADQTCFTGVGIA